MKKLLGILAVVAVLAMLAAPAMATDLATASVSVTLTVQPYASVVAPATAALSNNGEAVSAVDIAGTVSANVGTDVVPTITQIAPATWTATTTVHPSTPGLDSPFTVHLTAAVPFGTLPGAYTATLTVTITQV